MDKRRGVGKYYGEKYFEVIKINILTCNGRFIDLLVELNVKKHFTLV